MNEERVEIAVRKLPRLRIGIWSGRSSVVGVAAGNGNTKREQNESFEHDGLCRRLCASCQIFMKNEATLTSKREGWRIDPRQSLRQMHRRFSFTNDELAVAEGSNPALPDARRPIGIFGVLDEEIWTINADGTRPTRLTNNISNQNTPPALANSVFVMNLDGTAIQQITEPVGTSHDVYPNYSPDGSKIVFASDRMSSDGSSLDIFTINADGSSLTRIATGVTVGACADLIALPRPGAANHDGPKRAKFDRLTEASAMS